MEPTLSKREVKAIRERAQLTQEELATFLGLRHRSQVHHLETGRTPARGPVAVLLRLLDSGKISKNLIPST